MSDESVCSVCSRLTGFGDEDKGERGGRIVSSCRATNAKRFAALTARERWKADYRQLRSARRWHSAEIWFLRKWGYVPGEWPPIQDYRWSTRAMSSLQFECWQEDTPTGVRRIDYINFMTR